jgi:lipid-A-disaccharide synthase-like uncharacterized protein
MAADARTWMRRIATFALANALALACLWALAGEARAQSEVHAATPAAAPVEWGGEIDLQTRLRDVRVVRDGERTFVLVDAPDGPLRLPAREFLERVEAAQGYRDAHGWLFHVLNITTRWGILWVSVGFAGQALFTLRMLLQWWVSEREKRSIIPIGFWWGSLFGGALLFTYFVWRKDIVGIVGQTTGVFVYARNLVLIYRARAAERPRGFADPSAA